MMDAMIARESHRLAVQAELDAAKSQADRNKMGQFATPTELAQQILQYARVQLGEVSGVHFIDPAIGTGSFFAALLRVFPGDRVTRAVGYEIDSHYGEPATSLWNDTMLDIRLEDFTAATPPLEAGKFNLLICNPPYVRHHHIEGSAKQRLQVRTKNACGISISGLAGLYCYFLGLSHPWMAEGGLAGWLIPSEFMDVNYGASLKRYLLDRVTLLHIHRFDPNEVQFGDALVSSSVIWFIKKDPGSHHEIRMTFGGSLVNPRVDRRVSADTLRRDPKWTQYPMKECFSVPHTPLLGDFFTIKRGLVTGSNSYFILSAKEIESRELPVEVFQPILPSPRYLPQNEVLADATGNPMLEHQLFLLDCQLSEEEVNEYHPNLKAYLDEGKAKGVAERYICQHRSPWYAQEHRPPAPFLCTYLGRSDKNNGRPFRFILNHSKATAANVYLMLYPKTSLEEAIGSSPKSKRQVWEFLNSIDSKSLLSEGRVYGGGLHKLEPRELERVPATSIESLLSTTKWRVRKPEQGKLF